MRLRILFFLILFLFFLSSSENLFAATVEGPMKVVTVGSRDDLKRVLSQENTRFIIKHNHNLGGEKTNIHVGANSILDFQGGKLFNGVLVGNNTSIRSEAVQIFDTNIVLSGTWNVNEGYPEWFGAKGYYGSDEELKNMNDPFDSREAIQKSLDYFRVTRLSNKFYFVTTVRSVTESLTTRYSAGLVMRNNTALKGLGHDQRLHSTYGGHSGIIFTATKVADPVKDTDGICALVIQSSTEVSGFEIIGNLPHNDFTRVNIGIGSCNSQSSSGVCMFAVIKEMFIKEFYYGIKSDFYTSIVSDNHFFLTKYAAVIDGGITVSFNNNFIKRSVIGGVILKNVKSSEIRVLGQDDLQRDGQGNVTVPVSAEAPYKNSAISLENCFNVTVDNTDLENCYKGLTIWGSRNCSISFVTYHGDTKETPESSSWMFLVNAYDCDVKLHSFNKVREGQKIIFMNKPSDGQYPSLKLSGTVSEKNVYVDK